MILPFLNGIPTFLKAPVTWVLILANVFVFVTFQEEQKRGQRATDTLVEDDFFVLGQGRIYSEYILGSPKRYSAYMLDLAALSSVGRLDKMELLGHLAFRDHSFLKKAKNQLFTGDQIEVEYWRERVKDYLNRQGKNPNFVWGLDSSHNEIYRWFSYQFIHGGVWHLVFNMWFLLVFGGFLEPLVGKTKFLALYLLGGAFAALTFSFLSGFSSLPLVGASGSINGLIGLYAFLNLWRPIRFLFWVLPIKGYWGIVGLPGWVAVGVWLTIDLSGYLGTLQEFGGVAHSAHIGGFIIGCTAGWLFFKKLKFEPPEVFDARPQVQSF